MMPMVCRSSIPSLRSIALLGAQKVLSYERSVWFFLLVTINRKKIRHIRQIINFIIKSTP